MVVKRAMLLHAKSFLASPKHYLTSRRKLAAFGSQFARWADLDNHDAGWDERTAMIAAMIPAHSSVLEFGSGRERLADFLPEGCRYQPCDLVKRSERTLVCDLNQGFPALAETYDVIVFSGVIEYIHDLDRLMQQVRWWGRQCILSYAVTDGLDCVATRMNHGWVHHLSKAELLAVCALAGFTLVEQKEWQQQIIYRLQ